MNSDFETSPRAKVLVIDDESAILFLLKRILRDAGYDVKTAQSPREGLSLFGQESWDVVTVDRSMPEMDGEEVASKMKRLAPNVPIILVTGFPSAARRRDLFHAIIAKPFRATVLLQCLADCLERRGEEPPPATNPPAERNDLPLQDRPHSDDASGAAPPWEYLGIKHCASPA